MKRRDFLKIVGMAITAPIVLPNLLKAKTSTHPVDILLDLGMPDGKLMEEMREYCDESISHVEPIYQIEDEFDIPCFLYDSETGRCRELDFTNPADASMYVLHALYFNSELVDWEGFEAWSEHCSKKGLKLNDEDEIYSSDKSKTLLEYLEVYSKRGRAIVFWGDGQFKVVYSMPEYASGRILKIGIGNRVYDIESF